MNPAVRFSSIMLLVLTAAANQEAVARPPTPTQTMPPGETGITILSDDPAEGIEIEVRFAPFLERHVIAPDGNTYVQLSVSGCGATAQGIGWPEMPFKGFFLEIPHGVRVVAEVLEAAPAPQRTGFRVYPLQPPSPDSQQPAAHEFQIDAEAFATDAWLPSDLVAVEKPVIMRGRRLVFIKTFPLQYNPGDEGRLQPYSSIRLRLSYRGEVDRSGQARKQRLATPAWELLARRFILNYRAVEAPACQPGRCLRDGEGNLIIVKDELHDAVLPLAQWKYRKGFTTTLVPMSQVGNSANDLKSYIENAYETWDPAPAYVLLVGDSGDVPPEVVFFEGPFGEFASDHPLACVDGDDFVADLTIGRLPVHTEEECTNVVNKILAYDRTPDTGDWYRSFLAAAYFEDEEEEYYRADKFFMETAMTVYHFLDEIAGEPEWNVESALCTTNWPLPDPVPDYHFRENNPYPHREAVNEAIWGEAPYPDPVPSWIVGLWSEEPEATDDVAAAINGGVGLVLHRDHGSSTSWSHPPFENSHIDVLVNDVKTPCVLSINCLTGSFDLDPSGSNDCFCERFLKKSPGGCVGIVGATAISVSGHNELLVHGICDSFWPEYDPTFPESGDTQLRAWRPAEALNAGKYYMGYWYGYENNYVEPEFHMFHWFGDPEMMLRTEMPANLSVDYPPWEPVGEPVDITISVTKEGVPVGNARVAISRMDVNELWSGLTDASGEITFSGIVLTQFGRYDVVASAHDCVPYEDTFKAGCTRLVPYEYPTIQLAIEAASDDGDVVCLAEGEYTEDGNRDISFGGRPITVRSESGDPASCIIDCYDDSANPHRGFIFESGEGPDSVLEGVTIKNGWVVMPSSEPRGGGAIRCTDGSSPTIRNCVITDNFANPAGGGISCENSSPAVIDCTIAGNNSTFGGGMYLEGSSSAISGCVITGNSSSADGGGICLTDSSPQILSCTIAGNKAENQGGGMFGACSPANTIVWGNGASEGYDWWGDGGCFTECCNDLDPAGLDGFGTCVQSCVDGPNTYADPWFYEPEEWTSAPTTQGNYCLKMGSPCSAERQPDCGLIGALEVCTSCTYDVCPDGSADFLTIQEAIADDATQDGAVICLCEGTFTGDGNRDIEFLGKAVTVRSFSGDPYGCTINCQADADDPHRAFHFQHNEGPDSVLEGIRITNCQTFEMPENLGGGAIRCSNVSSPTIRNCVLEENYSTGGGGVCCDEQSSPTITHCKLAGNSAVFGGGIYAYDGSEPTVTFCALTGNHAADDGGGIFSKESSPQVLSCTISGNRAGDTGGGIFGGCIPLNTIIWGNCVDGGGEDGDEWYGDGAPGVWNCCNDIDVSGLGGFGTMAMYCMMTDIDADPLFLDPRLCTEAPTAEGNYYLQDDSPCAAHDPCGQIGAFGVGPGACCHQDTTCILAASEFACGIADGVWLGRGTTCEEVNCTVGACCEDLLCAESSSADCEGSGGPCDFDYWGNEPVCFGDCNGDGSVDPEDVGLIKFFYPTPPTPEFQGVYCRYDLNCDGTIGAEDVGLAKYYYADPCVEDPNNPGMPWYPPIHLDSTCDEYFSPGANWYGYGTTCEDGRTVTCSCVCPYFGALYECATDCEYLEDDCNGGCGEPGEHVAPWDDDPFDRLEDGDEVCGTTTIVGTSVSPDDSRRYADDYYLRRDTDWFVFTTTAPETYVTWSVHSDFVSEITVREADCEQTVSRAQLGGGGDCGLNEISLCVPQGDFFATVVPNLLGNGHVLPCTGERNRYRATLTFGECPIGACCLAGECILTGTILECEAAGGDDWHEGADCFGTPPFECPVPD